MKLSKEEINTNDKIAISIGHKCKHCVWFGYIINSKKRSCNNKKSRHFGMKKDTNDGCYMFSDDYDND